MPPLLQCSHNCQHLLVVDFIILLYQRKGFWKECHRMPFIVFWWLLRQYGSGHEIRAVCFDPKRSQVVWQGKNRMLRHSFYFYFYFEHLNFTRSYLIDMKISWSLDHIDLISTIYDLIIRWWSKICFFILTLHYYLHAFDMPLTHVFNWRLTCILHMLLRNMLLPYVLHVFALRTTHGH